MGVHTFMYIYFELCCLVVGEVFSSLPSWAVCAEWEGEGDVEWCVRYRVYCREMVTENVRIWETS